MLKKKPKARVYDLDGTLISSFLFRFFRSSFLRPLIAGIFSRLPVFFQIFLTSPTPLLKEALKHQRQSDGIKLFILSARKNTKKSCKKVNVILKYLGLKPDKIFLRPTSISPKEHKKKGIKEIAEEYEIIGIWEDEKRFYDALEQFGPISNRRP